MADYNDLTTQPIPRLVRRIAVPASVGFFFNTMFNVIDTYFGGLISTQVLAALSLSLPVYFIILALGTGLSTGTTALIANALGAGNRNEARLYAVQGITFGILSAIIVTVVGCSTTAFLFSILGATGDYMAASTLYMNTLFIGTIFFILAYMLNAILNALGDTRSFRNFLIAGFFLNILLDPWFIYGGFGISPMGIVGIALAMIIIQFLGNVYLGWRVNKTELIGDKDWHDIIPKPKPFKEIAHQGLPASVTMLTVGIGFFVITYFVSTFGKAAVAAYGIGIRVEQIVLVPTIGLNIATLTLVAQNNGARLFHRITETLRTVLTYGGELMALGTVIVFFFARRFMAFFSSDPQVIAIGTTYMKIDALVFYAYVILFVTVATLQGLKRPFFAVWIGLGRQLIAPLLIFPLFITIFGMGLLGIWWGFFLITWSAATFSLLYVRHTIKQMIT